MTTDDQNPVSTAPPPKPEELPPPPRGGLTFSVLLGLGIAFFVLATYWPILSAKALPLGEADYAAAHLTFQDAGWKDIARSFRASLIPGEGHYQPVTEGSFLLDSTLGGTAENLAPSHTINLAIHIANTLLLIVLLTRMFGHRGLACLVGMLYGVHPLTVEAIASVSGRGALLGAFFSLWCILFYVAAARAKSGKAYLGAFLAYGLAVLSHRAMAPLAFGLIVLDAWPLRRISVKTTLACVPFLAVCCGVVWVAVRGGLEHPPAVRSILLTSYAATSSLLKTVWPSDLSAYYLLPDPFAFSSAPLLLATALMLVLTAGFVYVALRWSGGALAGWVLFVLLVAPSWIAAYPSEYVNLDTYRYLPVALLLVPVTYFLGALWLKRAPSIFPTMRQLILTFGALYLAGFSAFQTQAYIEKWRDTESLQTYMYNLAPTSPLLQEQMGIVQNRQRRPDDAIRSFTDALAQNPDNLEVRNQLAAALTAQGRAPEALRYLEEAIATGQTNARTYMNHGLALGSTGAHPQALESFAKALELEPENIDALMGQAGSLRNLDRSTEAAEVYRTVTKLDPDRALAHMFLGFHLANMGLPEEAIAEYREILRLRPDDVEARTNMGILLNNLGKGEEAIGELRKAIELNPLNVKARYALGYALERNGNLEEAIKEYEQITRLDPEHRNAGIRLDLTRSRLERQQGQEVPPESEKDAEPAEPEAAQTDEAPADTEVTDAEEPTGGEKALPATPPAPVSEVEESSGVPGP